MKQTIKIKAINFKGTIPIFKYLVALDYDVRMKAVGDNVVIEAEKEIKTENEEEEVTLCKICFSANLPSSEYCCMCGKEIK